MSLAGLVMEDEDGGEVGVAGVFENAQDGFEGGAVFGDVREIDDAPGVAGELDHEVGEAAGAAGVEEELGGVEVDEPSGCVERLWADGELKAVEGGGEGKEGILLQGCYPFNIIGKGGVDAAVAFAGAGNALVRWDDMSRGIACVAHGAVGDVVTGFVDRRAVHVEGGEDVVVEVLRVGLF